MIRLQLLNFSKEKVDLIYIASLGIPTWSLHSGARSTNRKGRGNIPKVKPHPLLVDQLVTQVIGDILGFLPLTEL